MSRCFPYPPPGYSAKNDRNEALIESIKLQREREKAKAERKKERKREKKEKKRENKVNGKTNVRELGHGEKRKRNDEKSLKCAQDNVDLKGTQDNVGLKGKYIRQMREDETEQLERSGLTEEHEQPVCPQNPSYSSDSTQNSNKRRRQASPAGGISAHGNVLRIRLPLQKHKGLDATVNEERLCSTSVRTESTGKYNSEVGHGTSREELRSMETDVLRAGDVAPRRDNAQICSTSRGTGIYAQENGITSTGSKSFVNGIQTLESLYKDLVDHWVAPILQSEGTDLPGEEWLFQRNHRDGERCKPSRDVSSTGISNSWPHAQYLAEADIYALPFTVPF